MKSAFEELAEARDQLVDAILEQFRAHKFLTWLSIKLTRIFK